MTKALGRTCVSLNATCQCGWTCPQDTWSGHHLISTESQPRKDRRDLWGTRLNYFILQSRTLLTKQCKQRSAIWLGGCKSGLGSPFLTPHCCLVYWLHCTWWGAAWEVISGGLSTKKEIPTKFNYVDDYRRHWIEWNTSGIINRYWSGCTRYLK